MSTRRSVQWAILILSAWIAGCSAGDTSPEPARQEVGQSLMKGTLGAQNGDMDYCSDPLHRCDKGEGDCDANSQCLAPWVCGTDNGPGFGMLAGYDVCVPTHCINGVIDADETGFDCGGADCGTCFCPANGAAASCTATTGPCRCHSGWGDCDSDANCQPGLVCATDVGQKFGMPAGYDVCVAPHCVNGAMDADETGFDCGGADCGTCLCPTNGTATTCTAMTGPCRCHTGWGDCDSDANCQPGLVCATDMGQNFNMPAGYDVCVPPHCVNAAMDADETGFDCGGADCGTCLCPTNGTATTCTAMTGPCRCHSGWGDCDSDVNCQSGLVCATDVGQKFGMPAGYDVCVPPHCVDGAMDADETSVDCGGLDCGSCARNCAEILASGASTGDGVYTLNPGTGLLEVYCDMTGGGITYEQLAFGRYNGAYPGYVMIGVGDLQNPRVQQAFIWSYNKQGGMKNLTIGYTSDNCCFKDTGTGYVAFGSSSNYVYPADSTGTSYHCNSPAYNDPLMRFMVPSTQQVAVPPLPTTYFASGVVVSTLCSTAANPAFFFKRY